MESSLALTPLQPREFFGRPWSGEGEWMPAPWLGWLPGPRRFRFQSFTSWINDELRLMTLPVGRQVMRLRPERQPSQPNDF
jgi:hypothetical protein